MGLGCVPGGPGVVELTVPDVEQPAARIPRLWALESAQVGGQPLSLDGGYGVVLLPASARGQTLRVTYAVALRNPAVEVGSAPALLADVNDDLLHFSLGLALMVLGGVALLASFARLGRGFAWFGGFALSIGLMRCSEGWDLYPAVFPWPRGMIAVHTASVYLAPATLLLFVALQFGGRWAVLLRRLGLALGGAALPAAALQHLNVFTAYGLRAVANLTSLVGLGLILATVAPLARGGDRRARILLVGFSALSLSAVLEMMVGLGLRGLPVLDLGTLTLVGALGLVLQREYAAKHDALLDSQRALETQVAALAAKNVEVSALNAELRYQVAERSRELARVLPSHASLDGRARLPAEGDVVAERYRVRRLLGRGAMGAVFEVNRLADGARFALKVLLQVSSAQDAARFAREAQVAARLSHDNLIAVTDVGVTSSGGPFLVLEYVDGGSLDAQRERFGDVGYCLPLLADVARGLAALHVAKVTHRDLKPANVLLAQRDGRLVAKVADFGIARVEEVDLSGEAHTLGAAQQLTATGAFIGTPAYMAPEQPRAPGPEADVFAFGVTAYQLLTGAPPFNPPAIFCALSGAPLPKPRSLSTFPGVPVALGELLDRCLNERASSRPTAEELVSALAGVAAR